MDFLGDAELHHFALFYKNPSVGVHIGGQESYDEIQNARLRDSHC